MLTNLFLENAVLIIGVLGFLSFMVSLVTQIIKDIPGIAKIPTKFLAIVISMIITVLALVIYLTYIQMVILWYYIVLAVFASFVVAYISIYGWESFNELKDRFIKKE